MPKKTIWFVIMGGVFLFLDQLLKYIIRTNPFSSFYIWKPWLGWEYFANPGIAFSLPFSQILLAILTPIILLWLYYAVSKEKKQNNFLVAGLVLIIFGAVSNFIDRMLFGITIDYLRIATSVINIADIIIVLGVILLIKGERKKNS